MLRKEEGGRKPQEQPCPRCGCRGNYSPHGRYRRHLVSVGAARSVEVRRVRCMSCGATHAIIPEDVVPYRAYSESFVLAVLEAWASGLSNSQVRERFGISETTRRRMVAQARRRACALLACPPRKPAVASAFRGVGGAAAAAAAHLAAFGSRFAENVRLNNSRRRSPRRPRAST